MSLRGIATDQADSEESDEIPIKQLVPLWARSLLDAVSDASTPVMLWWGPRLQQAYNHAFADLLGAKHPSAQGAPAQETWAEAWEDIGPIVDAVRTTGVPFAHENFRLLVDRRGHIEETFWTVSVTPLSHQEPWEIDGLLIIAHERTAEIVARRRMNALRDLGTMSAVRAGSLPEAAVEALRALRRYDHDLAWRGILLVDGSGARLLSDNFADARAGKETGENLPTEALLQELAAGASGLSAVIPGLWTLPVRDSEGKLLGGLLARAGHLVSVNDDFEAFLNVLRDQIARLLNDAALHEKESLRVRRLAELDAAKNRMFEDISHDLRTPLTVVQAPLHNLLARAESGLSAAEKEDLSAALAATRRLQRLVDSLLEVARGKAHRLVLQPGPADASQLTRDAVRMLRGRAEEAGLQLATDIPEIPAVTLDGELWTRLVTNLVSNAITYTPTGSVSVTLQRSGGDLQLVVADTGVGIAPEHVARIFERFRQEGPTATRSTGFGIGLAVVAELLGVLGGRIDVASTVGVGTTFTVVVPAEAAAPTSVQERADNTAQRPRDSDEPPQVALGEVEQDALTGTVLVVEDDADLAALTVRLLARVGLRVEHVTSAEEALSYRGPIDLVVMDVRLPGMSGIDLLAALRQAPQLRLLPAVLLTAQADTESVVLGLQAGADDYITKPFEPSEFTARVASHLRLGKHRKMLLESTEARAANLERALVSNRTIGAAVGIIMARGKITQDDAFALLRNYSQTTNKKLRDVAEEVVMTGSVPSAN